MLIKHAKRIFMNEADASPGNGAPAAPPVQPAPTAAPTAHETPATPDISAIVDAKLKAFQNEFFANARKAGLLGKDKPADDKPAPAPAAAPASTGLSASDVKVMIDRARALERATVEHKLTDAQVKRMNAALEADKPEDVSAWTKSYLADMGLVKQHEQPTVTPPAQPAPGGAPISDKGSPAPGNGTNWHREFDSNPLNMSAAAIAAMNADLGVEVARKKRIERGQQLGSSIKVTTR